MGENLIVGTLTATAGKQYSWDFSLPPPPPKYRKKLVNLCKNRQRHISVNFWTFSVKLSQKRKLYIKDDYSGGFFEHFINFLAAESIFSCNFWKKQRKTSISYHNAMYKAIRKNHMHLSVVGKKLIFFAVFFKRWKKKCSQLPKKLIKCSKNSPE